jgi:hypothetical protein
MTISKAGAKPGVVLSSSSTVSRTGGSANQSVVQSGNRAPDSFQNTSSVANIASDPIAQAKTIGRDLGPDFTKAIDEALSFDGDFAKALEQVKAKVESGELSPAEGEKLYAGISTQIGQTGNLQKFANWLSELAKKKYDFGA